MKSLKIYLGLILVAGLFSCSKSGGSSNPPPVVPASFSFNSVKVNGVSNGFTYVNINTKPVIKLSFSAAINHATVSNGITIKSSAGAAVSYTTSYQNNDSTVVISPSTLAYLTQYTLAVSTLAHGQSGWIAGRCKYHQYCR